MLYFEHMILDSEFAWIDFSATSSTYIKSMYMSFPYPIPYTLVFKSPSLE